MVGRALCASFLLFLPKVADSTRLMMPIFHTKMADSTRLVMPILHTKMADSTRLVMPLRTVLKVPRGLF